MTPRFATQDDFLKYWGINLEEKLKTDDNDSDKVNTFLCRVEERLIQWVNANTFRCVEFDSLSDYQFGQMQIAVLEQAMYMWRNGDIGMDSGYDVEKGVVAHRSVLSYIEIAQPAINALKNAGLFNQKMKNRRREISGWGEGLSNFTSYDDVKKN